MKLGKLKASFLLEGYNITSYVTKYSVIFNSASVSTAKVHIAKPTGAFQILPGTLLHIFVKDEGHPVDYNKNFLVFEGSISSKEYSKSSGKSELIAIFKSTSKILDDSRFTKGAGTDSGLLDLFNTDVLYVNLGMGNAGETETVSVVSEKEEELKAKKEELEALESTKGSPADIKALKDEINLLSKNLGMLRTNNTTRLIFVNPANNPQSLISGTLWDEMVKEGKGYSDVLRLLLEGMTINVPYFRVIDESLRFTDQFAIYSNEELKPIFDKLNGFEMLSLSNPPALSSYRNILEEYCKYNMLKVVEMGLPGYHNGAITKHLIVPDLNFTAPPLFNVIYPSEYDDFQITHSFTVEPTRASYLTQPVTLTGGNDNGVKVIPTFISPSTSLEIISKKQEDKKIGYLLSFTEEEKYRGINVLEMQGNAFEQAWSSLEKNDDIKSAYEPKDLGEGEIASKEVQAMYRFISDYSFYKARLAARPGGYIAVDTFNPYWIAGFPGLIISPHYGPILVNFNTITLEGDASGFCRSSVHVTNPRFINELGEYVSMDTAPPIWYNKSFTKGNIGKNFYSKFHHKGSPSSILDWAGVQAADKVVGEKSIETAAKKIYDQWQKGEEIPRDRRERRLVTSDEYFKYLRVTERDADGFPSDKTWYRTANKIDPFGVAYYASKGKNHPGLSRLRRPFVRERGAAVAIWLDVKERTAVPGDVYPPETISPEESKKINSNYPNTTNDEEMKRRQKPVDPDFKDQDPSQPAYVPPLFDLNLDPMKLPPLPGMPKLDWPTTENTLPDLGLGTLLPYIPDIRPVKNWSPSPTYTHRSTKKYQGFTDHTHRGQDFFPAGDTDIFATANGIVTHVNTIVGREPRPNINLGSVGEGVSYGKYVEISHYDNNKELVCRTFYAHLSSILVKKGDFVTKGKKIAIMGNTGVSGGGSGNVHLHYEIYNADYLKTKGYQTDRDKWHGVYYADPLKMIKR